MSKKRALVWASLVMIAIASCLVFYRYLTQNSQRSRATGDIAVNIVQTSSVGFNNLPSGSEFTAGVVFNAASVGKISAFRLALGYNANVLDYLGVVGLYPDAGVDNVIEQKTGTGQNAKILIVKTYRTSINNLINNTVVNFKFKIKDGVVGSYPAALRVITSESGAVGPKADGSAYRYVMPGDETQDIRIVAAASSSSSSSLSSSSSSSSSQPSSSSSSSSRSSSSSSSSSSAASSSSRSSSSSSNSSSSSSVSSRSSSSSSVSTNCGCDTALNCGTGCSFSQYASSELPGVDYHLPIRCSLSSNLFGTSPSVSDRNNWCTRSLRTKGDADGNNTVDSTDYLYYVNAVLGRKLPSGVNPDFNGDGQVSTEDREIVVKTLGGN